MCNMRTSPVSSPACPHLWGAGRALVVGARHAGRAGAYLHHFHSAVLPTLRRLPAHRGAMVLRRPQDGLIRITVLRLWTSMAAVEEFARADPDAAVVEAAARDVLADFDTRVEHFELALHAEP